MKSKIFCFNRTIFKKNITHYWPLWLVYFIYLMLLLPANIWRMSTAEWYYKAYSEETRMYTIVEYTLDIQLRPAPTFLFAALMALAVFSYLYSAKNANMIHALPVNRRELFVTNYLSGLSFLVIPQLLVFLICVLVCLANQITCIQFLFLGFLCQMGVAFFAYSLAVFVAMFTGQIFAMPVYYLIVNYLYVGCLYIISRVVGLICYGVSETWNPGKSCILSPIYYLNNNLRSKIIWEEGGNAAKTIEIYGTYLVGIYALVAVMFLIAAYQIYKRRQIETAGDWVSVGIVKPVFRWGVALCGGVLISTIFAETLKQIRNADVYISMLVGMIIIGFICFFAAEMLLVKNFRVFQKKRLLEWAGFTVVAVVFITLFEVDAFQIERRLPKEDAIECAFVYMDYPIEVEDISGLLDLHQQVIDNKKIYQENEQEESGYYYTTFRYYLKDGSVFERRYPLPVAGKLEEDALAPTNQILTWERDTENLKCEILGVNYVNNRYTMAQIDLYNDKQEEHNYKLDDEEIKELTAALEKDIEEGNFNVYYLRSTAGVEGASYYYNNITLDYYNNNSYDSGEYYYDYWRVVEKAPAGAAVSTSKYINFGPECTNTIAALEKLGIVNDTWKLYTYEEFEKLITD